MRFGIYHMYTKYKKLCAECTMPFVGGVSGIKGRAFPFKDVEAYKVRASIITAADIRRPFLPWLPGQRSYRRRDPGAANLLLASVQKQISNQYLTKL
jgi:hypothetical protein